MNTLYDADIVLWSEQQADKLRRIARGEQPNEVDWENIVEEIESVGLSEIHTVSSLLLRALEHFLKAAAWPQALSARKWVHEAYAFLDDAEYRWAPSMAQRIDLARALSQGAGERVQVAGVRGRAARSAVGRPAR